MIQWLTVPEATRRNAYVQIAENTGMSPFAVEKDWWVVQTLSVVFDIIAGDYLVFKGGTSLSKAWGLISRFSEDIDLAIDRSFFGFEWDLSKSQKISLRKAGGSYTTGDFFDKLKGKCHERGFSELEFKVMKAVDSDQDPRIIDLYYPNLITPAGYLKARIQIEIGSRSLREPYTIIPIRSLIDEHYPESDFSQKPVKIPCVNPERTFLEKVFLLHEEFHRPIEKIRVDRLSRHIYDVVKISETDFYDIALTNKELYESIVNHRYSFSRVGGVDYHGLQPQTVNPIPIDEVIDAWKTDYQSTVVSMIYDLDPPSFDVLIDKLAQVRKRINGLPWQIETKF